jgi:hypothetical protein
MAWLIQQKQDIDLLDFYFYVFLKPETFLGFFRDFIFLRLLEFFNIFYVIKSSSIILSDAGDISDDSRIEIWFWVNNLRLKIHAKKINNIFERSIFNHFAIIVCQKKFSFVNHK